uniref:3-oxoacyl-[acyl-carrier-protein] reductase n=1 Tax=Candidatus Kentrum sp. DK TaxID=2126562 RepID=A0A450RTU1_9GAMM|nr:MAG: 3-oxoacyl-[acyl-carrier-protein] reductase [Candidatus Kentron sp. DK]
MEFTGKIALVTGASRGIGRAIALALGSQGATVIGTATTDAGSSAVARVFAEHGMEGRGEVLDVGDSTSVDALFSRLAADGLLPAILVNNAGVARDNLLSRMKEEEWDAVVTTNLTSLYRMCRICARSMSKAREGRIINIASIVGVTGNPGQTNYCATKAGIIGFTKALAREIGSRGVTVNAVAPGMIDTDMVAGMSPEQREAVINQIPLNRIGQAEDVAAAVVYLASSGAAYVTGETLHVNGGMYMG